MQWTNFDVSMMPPAARAMHVTLSSRGDFYLNQAVMVKLGEPVAVRLMFNKEERLIGIAAAPLKAKGAIELRMKYGLESPGRTFCARPFCLHLDILPERTIVFRDPKVHDGVVVLDLNSTDYPRPRAVTVSTTLR
jgi:hypothetical protein